MTIEPVERVCICTDRRDHPSQPHSMACNAAYRALFFRTVGLLRQAFYGDEKGGRAA